MVYIGTYNSGAAKLAIPILNAACLVMLSPANSYPGLTKAVEGVTAPGEPDTYYPAGYRNYARVINTDDDQGARGRRVGASRSATRRPTSSTTPRPTAQGIGQRLGPPLRQDRRRGPQRRTGSSESFDPKATDFRHSPRRSSRPAPTSSSSVRSPARAPAKLWKDIKQVNPNIQMFGPDGVNEKPWYDGTGAAGNGTYLTFGGVDISQLQGTGKTWADEYKTAHNGTQPPFYATYAQGVGPGHAGRPPEGGDQ